ncbi:MAG: septum formation initiator family protein [bacterium]|nr:septum formation initiator family protein [bacterium]
MILDLLKSRYFITLIAIFLVMVVIFLTKELQKRYEINQEISQLQADISELESTNRDSVELIKYLKTIEYQEKQARSLLNLQKPGEFAVNLPYRDNVHEAEQAQDMESNFRKWWKYFNRE